MTMRRNIKISFLLFNIIISLVLLFNNAFFIPAFLLSKTLSSVMLNVSYYTLVFVSFLVVNYFIYFLSFKKQKIFKSIMFILILSSFIIGYYSLKYHINIDYIFIINIMNEFAQTKEVISIKDIFIIVGFIASLMIMFIILKINYSSFKIRSAVITISILSSIAIIATLVFKYSYIMQFHTDRALYHGIRRELIYNINYYKYFYSIRGIFKYYKSNPSNEEIMATIEEGDVLLRQKGNNITTVFVMSDSVRAKSMFLFGYNLNTNPNLQKLYENKQIYIFKQEVCHTRTFVSLNCMLSLQNGDNFRKMEAYYYAKEKITKYFNYLEIDTYYLYNNDLHYFYSGYKYVPYRSDVPSLDSKLLPYLYKTINSHSQFITVNLRGAHVPYDLMLEERFNQFKHDYDNKILQTDHIWSEIINHLSKQKTAAFAILTADHGESLGEYYNGIEYFLHGAEISVAPAEQKEVPLIIYINDAYKKLYPSYAKNIESNMKKFKGKLVQSDIISHSLLHCSGIEGKVVDKSLSLCSK